MLSARPIVDSWLCKLSMEALTASRSHITLPPYMMYWSMMNLSFSENASVGLAMTMASKAGLMTMLLSRSKSLFIRELSCSLSVARLMMYFFAKVFAMS